MSLWFVYTNRTYYPYAEIVEAADAEGALARFDSPDRFHGVAVFPLDALARWESGLGESIEDALREDE